MTLDPTEPADTNTNTGYLPTPFPATGHHHQVRCGVKPRKRGRHPPELSPRAPGLAALHLFRAETSSPTALTG